MKKIVIVEDRPWVMESCIQELKKSSVIVDKILYFANDEMIKEEVKPLMNSFCENIQVPVEEINVQNFVQSVDYWYNQNDVLILLDVIYKTDVSNLFWERASIRYAKSKLDEDRVCAPHKIKLYSTDTEALVNMLNKNFPGQVISVSDFVDNQVILDIEAIKEAIKNLEAVETKDD